MDEKKTADERAADLAALMRASKLELATLAAGQTRQLYDLDARLADAIQERIGLAKRLQEAESELWGLRNQVGALRREGSVLVECLAEAWWIRATDALRTIESVIKTDQRADDLPF